MKNTGYPTYIILIILISNGCFSKRYQLNNFSFEYPVDSFIQEYSDENGRYITLKSKEKNIIRMLLLSDLTSLIDFAKKDAQYTKTFLSHYHLGDSDFETLKKSRYKGVSEVLEKFSINILFSKILMFKHYYLKIINQKYLVVIVQGSFDDYKLTLEQASQILSSLLETK